MTSAIKKDGPGISRSWPGLLKPWCARLRSYGGCVRCQLGIVTSLVAADVILPCPQRVVGEVWVDRHVNPEVFVLKGNLIIYDKIAF